MAIELLPEVKPSRGLVGVSPETMRSRAGETSSSSAAICARAVRTPWPISTLPVASRTRPASSKPIQVPSSGLSSRLLGSVVTDALRSGRRRAPPPA